MKLAPYPPPVAPPTPSHFTLTLSREELHDVAVMVAQYEIGNLKGNPVDTHTHDCRGIKRTLIELYQIHVGSGR